MGDHAYTGHDGHRMREVLVELVVILRPRPDYGLGPVLDLPVAQIITADLYVLGERLHALLLQRRSVVERSAGLAREWLPLVADVAVEAQSTAARWRVVLGRAVRLGPFAAEFVADVDRVSATRRKALDAVRAELELRGITEPPYGAAGARPRPQT